MLITKNEQRFISLELRIVVKDIEYDRWEWDHVTEKEHAAMFDVSIELFRVVNGRRVQNSHVLLREPRGFHQNPQYRRNVAEHQVVVAVEEEYDLERQVTVQLLFDPFVVVQAVPVDVHVVGLGVDQDLDKVQFDYVVEKYET